MSVATAFFSAISMTGPAGQLAVYTDKPYYVPGELLTGRVQVSLVQNVQCRALNAYVIGVERCEWNHVQHRTEHRPDGTMHTRKVLKRHRARQFFFNVTLPLANFANNFLQAGQYTFPFQFQLPDGLPGSFYERTELPAYDNDTHIEDCSMYPDFCDSDDDINVRSYRYGHWQYRRPRTLAVISYKVRAMLDVTGFMSVDLYARQPIIVHPRIVGEIRPAHIEADRDVMFLCCINKGHCKLIADFDKNAYCPGETAQITANVNNQSTKPMKMVVKLMRRLEMQFNSWGMLGSNYNDEQEVLRQEYAVVPPMTQSMVPMPLPLPPSTKPSTQSQFIKCTYSYSVQCQIDWAPDVIANTPVLVYAPQPPQWCLQPLF